MNIESSILLNSSSLHSVCDAEGFQPATVHWLPVVLVLRNPQPPRTVLAIVLQGARRGAWKALKVHHHCRTTSPLQADVAQRLEGWGWGGAVSVLTRGYTVVPQIMSEIMFLEYVVA